MDRITAGRFLVVAGDLRVIDAASIMGLRERNRIRKIAGLQRLEMAPDLALTRATTKPSAPYSSNYTCSNNPVLATFFGSCPYSAK